MSVATAVLVSLGSLVLGPVSPADTGAGAGTSAMTLRTVDLEYGESGSCVERLQRRLNELGLDCSSKRGALAALHASAR